MKKFPFTIKHLLFFTIRCLYYFLYCIIKFTSGRNLSVHILYRLLFSNSVELCELDFSTDFSLAVLSFDACLLSSLFSVHVDGKNHFQTMQLVRTSKNFQIFSILYNLQKLYNNMFQNSRKIPAFWDFQNSQTVRNLEN